MAAGEIKARDFEAAYLEEMDRIWDLNEERLRALRSIRGAREDRQFWLHFCEARDLARKSDAALLHDMILRP